MRRKLIKIWSVVSIVTLVSWVGLYYFVATICGKDISFIHGGVIGLIMYLFLCLCGVLGIYFFFPRTKYMDSHDSSKPSFKFTCSSEIDVPQGIDFNSLKTEISKKWFITFSDDTGQVLKFTNFFKWSVTVSAAAWLKFDDDTGKIHFECFSLSGLPRTVDVKKMQKDIEQYLTACKPS